MNTSHSVQKSFEQSVHRYRPRGLIPSAPVSIAAPAAPSESPFIVDVVPFALSEVFLPGPESVVSWNILEHAWHVGLELAVSSTVILQRNSPQGEESKDQPKIVPITNGSWQGPRDARGDLLTRVDKP